MVLVLVVIGNSSGYVVREGRERGRKKEKNERRLTIMMIVMMTIVRWMDDIKKDITMTTHGVGIERKR